MTQKGNTPSRDVIIQNQEGREGLDNSTLVLRLVKDDNGDHGIGQTRYARAFGVKVPTGRMEATTFYDFAERAYWDLFDNIGVEPVGISVHQDASGKLSTTTDIKADSYTPIE
jgi:hypothetical protein